MTRYIAILLTLVLLRPCLAAEVETREFQVNVDGRPAGSYTMTITQHPDGTITQTGQANVRIRVLIKTFIYTYNGTETWSDGRLMKFESMTNDDGKHYQLRGVASARGLDFSVNGRAALASEKVWPMSFWKLPAPEHRNGPVELLEIDNGKVHKCQMRLVGTTRITVDGQPLETRQFQIRGGTMADLWFDQSDRLVRHETVNDGHPTVLHLLRIRTQPSK
jgi:hypothetical protein